MARKQFSTGSPPSAVTVIKPDGTKTIVKDFKDIFKEQYPTYAQYLKSAHWKNTKRKYRKSKAPQYCLICGDKKYQLHHLTYERIGREHLGDFVPLCATCHGWLHKKKKTKDSLWKHTKKFIKHHRQTIQKVI